MLESFLLLCYTFGKYRKKKGGDAVLGMFYPRERAADVFAIDYQKLYDIGYRAVLFDIDNTLVHHGDDSTEEVDALFLQIHQIGLKTMLVSNNGVDRIERFLRCIDSPYIANADKPDPTCCRRAMETLNVTPNETVFIGDQVFTDILCANRCGIASILVDFIRAPNETKIGIRRHVERVILWCWRLCRPRRKRIGDIWKEGL